MDSDRFNPALEEILRDPITRRLMDSDKVEMAALVALLTAARRRLAAPAAMPRNG
jgi:hypothetical protein